MGQIIKILLKLFIATCIFEIIPLLFFKNRGKRIATSLLCNIVTNPLLNVILFLVSALVPNQAIYIVVLLILELAVVALESFIIYNVMDENVTKCIKVSAICNAFSFLMGLVVTFFEKI